MQYFLRLPLDAASPILPIDKQRFSHLKASKVILSEALEFEEEYQMMLSNYIDLEKESLNTSISYMVRTYRGHADFFDARLALNRRLMNFLTSVRLYSDRLTAHCSVCLPQDTGIKGTLESLRATQYESNFDYRFMEALRNYIQHYGSAVHHVTFGGRLIPPHINGLVEISSSFSAAKKVLASDSHFKKQILDEMPDEVDLISASRGYVEALSSIHNNVRKMVSKTVNEARSLIQTAIDDYRAVYKEDIVVLSAYLFDDKTEIDQIALFLYWDDIRIHLQERNKQLTNLKRSYVTGQSKKR
jgi:hypothetical protein